MSLYIPSFSEILAVAESRGALSDAPHLWEGLVGAWPLQQAGGSTAFDVSGHGRHGTLTNMDPGTDWVVTEKGRALDFGTYSDYRYVTMGDVLNLSGTLSASMWFCPGGLEWDKGFFCRTSSSSPYVQYGFKCNGGVFYWYVLYDSVNRSITFSPQPTVGIWQHVAAYSTPGDQRCYLNGVQAGHRTFPAVEPAAGFYLDIGRYRYGTNYAAAEIALCALWSRALSPSEIQELYEDPWAKYRLRSRPFAATAATPSTIELPTIALAI